MIDQRKEEVLITSETVIKQLADSLEIQEKLFISLTTYILILLHIKITELELSEIKKLYVFSQRSWSFI